MEVSLHSHIGQHPNVIEWFASGEDNVWRWIAMEFAEGETCLTRSRRMLVCIRILPRSTSSSSSVV